MPTSVKILVVCCSLAFLGTFLLLAKKGSVKPFYSALWLLVSVGMLSLAVFEKQYKHLADLLGIRDASFLVFVGAILFLLVYIVHLSVKISEMSDRVQELISHVSILDRQARLGRNEPEPGDEPRVPAETTKG